MAVSYLVNPDPEPFLPLFKQAGEEVGIDYEIKPDFQTYRQLMADGDMLGIGCVDGGKPIGYIGVTFNQSMFNPDVIEAVVASYFVLPEYRHGTIAGRLIAKIEPEVRRRTDRLVFQCEQDNPLSRILSKRGFTVIDQTWQKVWR